MDDGNKMTQKEVEFWKRQRALAIEEEKALTELRAVVIGRRKSIEALLAEPLTPHEPDDNETLTGRMTYTT